MPTLRRLAPALAVALLVGAALFVVTGAPLVGDDDYVLANLTSPDLGDRFLAYNVDFPGGRGGEAWYEGFGAFQRRYLRVLPSALLSLEVAVLGSDAESLHRVSLAIHVLNCVLGYLLLARFLPNRVGAALVAVVLGVHPIVREPVEWLACQPILVAGTCSLLAAHLLVRLDATSSRLHRAALVGLTLLAMTSYESAVVLPLVLLAVDRGVGPPARARRPAARAPRDAPRLRAPRRPQPPGSRRLGRGYAAGRRRGCAPSSSTWGATSSGRCSAGSLAARLGRGRRSGVDGGGPRRGCRMGLWAARRVRA